jgi:hypothetical protein
MTQNYHKRHEQKYLLPFPLSAEITRFFEDATEDDEYGTSDIYTLYFDTPDFQSKRKNAGGKGLREKFRIRSYGPPNAQSTLFFELKKKYKHTTYKRRLAVAARDAAARFQACKAGRVANEIEWFLHTHDVSPCFTVAYHRVARRGKTAPEFRATFDTDIRAWAHDGPLIPLIRADQCLLELKSPFAMPFELCGLFSKLRLYPARFSKSREAYQMLYPHIRASCASFCAAPWEEQ